MFLPIFAYNIVLVVSTRWRNGFSEKNRLFSVPLLDFVMLSCLLNSQFFLWTAFFGGFFPKQACEFVQLLSTWFRMRFSKILFFSNLAVFRLWKIPRFHKSFKVVTFETKLLTHYFTKLRASVINQFTFSASNTTEKV